MIPSDGLCTQQLNRKFPIFSFHASQYMNGSTSGPYRKRKRDEIHILCVQELIGKLKDIDNVMHASRQGKSVEKLSKIIRGMKGFN